MFPLRDTIPRVHTPWAVWTILGLNLAVFLWQQGLAPSEVYTVFHVFGVVPARFSFPDWALSAGFPPGGEASFFTHMFLHGGWGHFLVNMWTLWIFGDNIEDVMGPWRFTVFYLTCGSHMSSSPPHRRYRSSVPRAPLQVFSARISSCTPTRGSRRLYFWSSSRWCSTCPPSCTSASGFSYSWPPAFPPSETRARASHGGPT